MVARGHTNKTIARVLDISLWTVSTHLRRVFAKLGVSSRAAMVAAVLHQLSIDDVTTVADGPRVTDAPSEAPQACGL